MTTNGYTAFLRGINVGGSKKVPMADLRALFEKMGYTKMRTLLNSGNIMFETSEEDRCVIQKQIEEQVEKKFGFHVDTIIRTHDEIQSLVAKDPFRDITVTKDTRLYVTFLPEKSKSALGVPYESPEKDFAILYASDTEVCSILDLSKGKGTVDVMKVLEKEYGKNITTRNWNTILKIHGKLEL